MTTSHDSHSPATVCYRLKVLTSPLVSTRVPSKDIAPAGQPVGATRIIIWDDAPCALPLINLSPRFADPRLTTWLCRHPKGRGILILQGFSLGYPAGYPSSLDALRLTHYQVIRARVALSGEQETREERQPSRMSSTRLPPPLLGDQKVDSGNTSTPSLPRSQLAQDHGASSNPFLPLGWEVERRPRVSPTQRNRRRPQARE